MTGRQHQIRCHLAHIGSPTVCAPQRAVGLCRTSLYMSLLSLLAVTSIAFKDALYTSVSTFEADLTFSPRNWLHRHRLAFLNSDGVECEVTLPIPQDLQGSLVAVGQLLESCRRFTSSHRLGHMNHTEDKPGERCQHSWHGHTMFMMFSPCCTVRCLSLSCFSRLQTIELLSLAYSSTSALSSRAL